MIDLEAPLAAYLRASSYVQEDSHERQQAVIGKFLLDNSSAIPPGNWFSDFRPRDAAAFAPDFQTLLAKARRGEVKTVVVSNLDRWGTADVDEFFEFRGVLLKAGCTLWSVEDGDLTSKKMADIITIIVKAEQMREYVRRGAKTTATGKGRLAQAPACHRPRRRTPGASPARWSGRVRGHRRGTSAAGGASPARACR
jgi:DNA invertase Pin-like site-specific DNA recombinase